MLLRTLSGTGAFGRAHLFGHGRHPVAHREAILAEIGDASSREHGIGEVEGPAKAAARRVEDRPDPVLFVGGHEAAALEVVDARRLEVTE